MKSISIIRQEYKLQKILILEIAQEYKRQKPMDQPLVYNVYERNFDIIHYKNRCTQYKVIIKHNKIVS